MAAAMVGCKTREVQDRSWLDGGGVGSSLAKGAATDGAADAPRCQPSGARLAIPGGALVASDGISDDGTSALFGLLRPNGAAAWARLDHPGGTLAVHDLPGGDPDAPPPELALHGGSPPAAFLLYSESQARPLDAGRARDAGAPMLDLVVAAIHGDKAEPVSRIPEPRDDSLDADLAFVPSGSGLVVWDDDDPFARFGRIRAARVDSSGKVTGEPLILTPEGTDAESPQVVATRAGFVVVYRVRRGEVRDAGLVEDAVEAPGERRAFHWLEAVVVPLDGAAPLAPPRALTSATGHIGAFVVPPEPAADDAFDLVARDDDAPRDAAGGKLVAIHLGPDLVASPSTAIAPRVLVPAGVGSGAISLVSSRGASFAIFAGEDDAARLVSLDPAGGPVHLEPALDGADPVSLVGLPPTVIALVPDAPAAAHRPRAMSLGLLTCR
jgi:hypothetical protein